MCTLPARIKKGGILRPRLLIASMMVIHSRFPGCTIQARQTEAIIVTTLADPAYTILIAKPVLLKLYVSQSRIL